MPTKLTITDIPLDVLRSIGKKLDISRLTKLCIAVPELDRLIGNSDIRMYKTLICYESIPWVLLENICRFDSVKLFLEVPGIHQKIALYNDSIMRFCWENHCFKIYDLMNSIYYRGTGDMRHVMRCEDVVIKGDMKRLRYAVRFYTDEEYGKQRWEMLMDNGLSKNTMHDPEVYLHMLALGCATYGLSWVFQNMCIDSVPLTYIEKLYNGTRDIYDYSGMLSSFAGIIQRIRSVEIIAFLNSVSLASYPITDNTFYKFDIYPEDVKKFAERCTVTPGILRMLLAHAIDHRNIENVKYLAPLDWNPHYSIYNSFSKAVYKNCYTIVDVLTPHLDKVIGCNEEPEIEEYMLKYLCCINYQSKSFAVAAQINAFSEKYTDRINKLVEYADKF